MDAKKFHNYRLQSRKQLGAWLKEVRNENRLLLRKVADGMGIDEGFASKIENGKCGIPENKLEEIVLSYRLTDEQLKQFVKLYLDKEQPELLKILRKSNLLIT